MQSPYDPSRMLNGCFVAVASPAGVGHKQSLGKGHQEQTFGSTVRRPLSSQTSRSLTFA